MSLFARKPKAPATAMRFLFAGNMVKGADTLHLIDPETGRQDWFIRDGMPLISVHRDGLVEIRMTDCYIDLNPKNKREAS